MEISPGTCSKNSLTLYRLTHQSLPTHGQKLESKYSDNQIGQDFVFQIYGILQMRKYKKSGSGLCLMQGEVDSFHELRGMLWQVTHDPLVNEDLKLHDLSADSVQTSATKVGIEKLIIKLKKPLNFTSLPTVASNDYAFYLNDELYTSLKASSDDHTLYMDEISYAGSYAFKYGITLGESLLLMKLLEVAEEHIVNKTKDVHSTLLILEKDQ